MSYKSVTSSFHSAASTDAPVQENGEANGEVKEPKKCDIIMISGRKERCEAAVEALKVWLVTWFSLKNACNCSDCMRVYFVKYSVLDMMNMDVFRLWFL